MTILLEFLFTYHQYVQCDWIMRWWSSNIGQWLLQNQALLLIVTYLFTRPPCLTLILLDLPPRESPLPSLSSDTAHLAFKQDHPPTWASPVSVPAYHSRVISPRDLPLTWESPISDESYPYPSITFLLPVPRWYPLPPRLPDHRRLRPRASSKIYFKTALNWASAAVCLHNRDRLLPPPAYPSSPASRLQICSRVPTTVPPLLGADRCMSVCNASHTTSTLSRPLPAARSHPVTYSPVYICPLTRPTSTPLKKAIPEPPLCKTPQTW